MRGAPDKKRDEAPATRPPRRGLLAALLVAGLVLPQFALYAPSFLGRKLYLPMDTLGYDQHWPFPRQAGRIGAMQNRVLSDPVLYYAPRRVVAGEELLQGRPFFWNPYSYCGHPMLLGIYSVFEWVNLAAGGDPRAAVWMQLAKALAAGLGAYLYFRFALGVGVWSSLAGAWCYPLTGALVMWSHFETSSCCLLLPWSLLAVEATVRVRWWGAPALALVTALAIHEGITGEAGLVLLASGLYLLWQLAALHGRRALAAGRPGRRTLGAALLAWTLGLALAAPSALVALDYIPTSRRYAERRAGAMETHMVGAPALVQVVLPYCRGAERPGAVYVGRSGNRVESSSAAYAGLFVTLVLAPLAFGHPRLGRLNVFWVLFAVLGLGQILDFPLVNQVYGLPGVRLIRGNRFTVLAAWAFLALAVTGLEAHAAGRRPRRGWALAPAALLAALGGFCVLRAQRLPDDALERLRAGAGVYQVPVADALQWITRAHQVYLALAVLALAAWGALALLRQGRASRWIRPSVAGAAILELGLSAVGVNPQCDPAAYYPESPLVQALRSAPPGRVAGDNVYRANLSMVHRLRDVRGYDGADPVRLIELLRLANPAWKGAPPYAHTHSFAPPTPVSSPILDMLNLRYVVRPGAPPPGARVLASTPDHWVEECPRALPRPYVPRRAEEVPDDAEGLRRLGRPGFDPRELALAAGRAGVPPGPVQGEARILEEWPGHVAMECKLDAPGLVVLADLWYPGWSARLEGRSVPVLRVNHALMGAVAPQGTSRLVMDYEPPRLRWGVAASLAGLAALAAWAALRRRAQGRLPGGAAPAG
ncbi:MAG: hypothetical protein HY722_15380 [Planctomycetes bacterium]|nr:hypothetical protein [Planctomycetota bacterium]